MPRSSRLAPLVLTAALLAAMGCHTLTEPAPLQSFTWMVVENPQEIEEGIDAAVFFGDIDLLGQFKTPTLCFKPTADFSQNGSELVLRVTAKPTSGVSCADTPGGFRYTALLRGLGSGDFTLHVIHSVNGTDQEYTESMKIP